MKNFNFEAIFIDKDTSLEVDRISINYDPKLEAGDVYKSYEEICYTIVDKKKIIDTVKEKMYYIYYVEYEVSNEMATALSYID